MAIRSPEAAIAPASRTAAVTATVTASSWDPSVGGSITLQVTRGTAQCCSAWDWVGIYQDGVRVAYVHSGDGVNPVFSATFPIPSTGGIFYFWFSTSVDSWAMHDLGISETFGESVPIVTMASLIPSYWWPTDGKWDALIQAVDTSGIPPSHVTVVLNVNNGYNTDPAVVTAWHWGLWLSRAQSLSSAGIKIIAYVNLCADVVNFACSSQANQGSRPFSEVQAEMDKYVTELGTLISGFFLDDAGHSGLTTSGVLAVTNYAVGLGMETVHNPGAMSQDVTLFDASNVTVMREATTPGTGSPHYSGFSVEKSAMLLHSVDAASWSGYLATAQENGYKYFYATSGGWDSSPSYLADMLTSIKLAGPSTTTTTSTPSAPYAKGDPHLRNVYGQAFDLMRPGRHTLLLLPRGADV